MSWPVLQLSALLMTRVNSIHTFTTFDVLSVAARKCHTLLPRHKPKEGATQDYVFKPWGQTKCFLDQ